MSVPIDYAPAKPRSWRWTLRGFVVLAALMTVVELCRYGPLAWRQVGALCWQHQCLTYQRPPDQVVYDEGPAAAADVSAGRAVWYVASSSRFPRPIPGWSTPPAAVVSAGCYSGFARLVPSRPVPDGATLFCHELRSADGVRRLVVVEHAPVPDAQRFILGYDVQAAVYEPATLTRPPQDVSDGTGFEVMGYLPRCPTNLRIYAGQPDPADPAHFTIRYEMWGQVDTVDGRLEDGGIRVRMAQRHPPDQP